MTERSFLYTLQDCGCLAFCMVNEAREVKAAARDIAGQARKGRVLREAAHVPPLNCERHEAERAAAKAAVS